MIGQFLDGLRSGGPLAIVTHVAVALFALGALGSFALAVIVQFAVEDAGFLSAITAIYGALSLALALTLAHLSALSRLAATQAQLLELLLEQQRQQRAALKPQAPRE
jgi:hypothetical protein